MKKQRLISPLFFILPIIAAIVFFALAAFDPALLARIMEAVGEWLISHGG